MAARRKRRTSAPLLLFWSKRDQRRFIDAVEHFHGLVFDLENRQRELAELLQLGQAKRRPKTPRAAPTTNGHTPTEGGSQ